MTIKKTATLSLVLSSLLTTLNAQSDTTALEDINVVTATGFEQNVSDAPASISVITSKELEKKSYTDITDALKNVPGVYVTGGGSNQSIMIRGMSSNYTLFLIDGKPMQSTGAFELNGTLAGAQMNFLPPMEAIERIEIIRGPASSLYGSDAMGGVINIITKKSDKVYASINTEYIKADSSNKVNNDSFNTSLFLNVPLIEKHLSFQLTGGFLNSDESDFVGNDDSAASDPEFKRKNIGTKFIYTPDENNTITAGYTYSLQERTHHAGKSLADDDEDIYYKSIKYNYSLAHEAKYDDFLINSYVNYDKAKNPTRTNSTTGNGIEFETLTLNTQGSYSFDSNILSVGATYKDENLEDGATSSLNNSIVKMERYQWSIFAENEWSITNDLALTLSGRYDNNEDFGDHFSPKAYLVYHLTNNWTLKGGVTTGYKAPSLRQAASDFAGVSRGGVMIGNPDLTPEKSVNYETGVAYFDDELGLKASLVVFKTDFKDKITRTGRVCEANQPCTYKGTTYDAHQYGYTAYENVDKAEIKGIELTTDYDITENLAYKHSYTYTDSEQKSGDGEGHPLNDISKHMFNASLEYQASKNLNLWTQVNYRGKTAGSTPSSRSPEVTKQPSYTFTDIGLVYDLTKNIKLKAGVYNVANKEVNTDDSYYVLDGRRYAFAMNFRF